MRAFAANRFSTRGNRIVSSLSRIQSGKSRKPPRLMCYGVEGIGKSTLGAQAPKPIFIPTEDGLDQIGCDRFPLARSFEDVRQSLSSLQREKHDYETIVIDSLDWLEHLIFDELCREHNVKSIEQVAGGYGKGYSLALNSWRGVIGQLDHLRNERGMVILLLAHARVERFEDPESAAYDRYSPRLNRHATAFVCEWCDAVLFATRRFRTQSEDAGFNRQRTIAHPIGKAGGERILRCVGGPSCVAKNRYGIVDEISLSWTAIVEALSRK